MIIGLVGKPSSGKSTFFKAATLAEVAIAPYPFTTIEKNEGVGYVKKECVEKEFKVKCKPKFGYCINGTRFIPVKLIDVAGLVPGAHKGKGRGNAFLDDLSEADILIHVLDASGKTDAEGNVTEGYNVIEEVKFLQDEIDFWIRGILAKNWEKFARKVHTEKKKLSDELAKQVSGLKIKEESVIRVLNELNLNESILKWDENDLLAFARNLRKEAKPIIIAANKMDVGSSEENLKKLKEDFPDLPIIACSSEIELLLREAAKKNLIEYIPGASEFEMKKELNEQQKKALEFVKKYLLKHKNTGIQQCLNNAVFDILGMRVVYPVENENKLIDKDGNILPDAFLLPRKSDALNLAEKVHTDVAKNYHSAIDARTKKRLPKDYELRDGDVIKIMTH